jgi:LPXTG-motif cell wall-anchored protein
LTLGIDVNLCGTFVGIKKCGSDIPGMTGLLPIPLFNTTMSFSNACAQGQLHAQRAYAQEVEIAKAQASLQTGIRGGGWSAMRLARRLADAGAGTGVTADADTTVTVDYVVTTANDKAMAVIKSAAFKKGFLENLKKDVPGVKGIVIKEDAPTPSPPPPKVPKTGSGAVALVVVGVLFLAFFSLLVVYKDRQQYAPHDDLDTLDDSLLTKGAAATSRSSRPDKERVVRRQEQEEAL